MNLTYYAVYIWLLAFPFQQTQPDDASPKTEPTSSASSIDVRQPLVRHPDRVDLSFAIAGRLRAIHFEEGQFVQAGTLLATLENEREKAEYGLRKAKAEATETLEVAKARVNSATAAKTRAIEANQLLSRAIPAQELRRLELDLELAVAELREKELDQKLAVWEAESAKAAYNATELRAPFDGIITRRFLAKGSATDGMKPVAQIVDMTKLRVEGYVALDQSRSLRVGDKMIVRQQSGNEVVFELGFIDIGAQQVQKQIRVWGQTSETEGFIEGETTTARIVPTR